MAEHKIGPPLFKIPLLFREAQPLFKKTSSCRLPQTTKSPWKTTLKSPFKSIKKPLKALNLLFKNLKTSSSSSRNRNKTTLFNKSLKLVVRGKKKFPRSSLPEVTFNTEKKPEPGRGSEPRVVADLGKNIWSIHEYYIPHPSPPTTADEDEELVVPKPQDENEASTGRWSIGDTNFTVYRSESVRDFFGDSPIIWDA